jgi:putative sugar O-methyltransferase
MHRKPQSQVARKRRSAFGWQCRPTFAYHDCMTLGRDGLLELLEEMKTAPELYRPSAFWSELVEIGLKQIETNGLENFKRTVNMTYFNWGVLGILQHQFVPVFARFCRKPSFEVLRARFPNAQSRLPGTDTYHSVSNFRVRLRDAASFSRFAALIYEIYVAMLWEFVAEIDTKGVLSRLHEPRFGNPFLIQYRGHEISQDLCNSVHEFYSSGAAEAADKPVFHIAELGAGYGRLAYVCLEALPNATYCLIDIPPALNVAQEYLSRVFPREKIFYFRPFRDYAEIRSEFESSRIRFLAAHQIELLPPKQFDLFVNISSLHEMTRAQIENYLAQIGRICRGRFYTKQWRVSQTSVNGFVIREHEYPIPGSWRCLYHRHHPVQRMFFEALYETGASG